MAQSSDRTQSLAESAVVPAALLDQSAFDSSVYLAESATAAITIRASLLAAKGVAEQCAFVKGAYTHSEMISVQSS